MPAAATSPEPQLSPPHGGDFEPARSWRDDDKNTAMYSTGRIQPGQLQEAVDRARKKLDPKEVLLVRYSVGVDVTGETTIFFRILLTDYASEESRLGEVTGRVAGILFDEIQPWEKWEV